MNTIIKYNATNFSGIRLVLDMTDCYTWSFPEFTPFCSQLYYFSNYKDFDNRLRA